MVRNRTPQSLIIAAVIAGALLAGLWVWHNVNHKASGSLSSGGSSAAGALPTISSAQLSETDKSPYSKAFNTLDGVEVLFSIGGTVTQSDMQNAANDATSIPGLSDGNYTSTVVAEANQLKTDITNANTFLQKAYTDYKNIQTEQADEQIADIAGASDTSGNYAIQAANTRLDLNSQIQQAQTTLNSAQALLNQL